MRLLPPILIAGVAAALVTTSAVGQRPDDQLAPRSVELLKQGNAHLAAGRFVEADETLETALAVDPRNRAAYNSLARVAQRQKLFGQSIRFTKKALQLEPNDRDAIAIQGEAMVELGALARAKENLAKLQAINADLSHENIPEVESVVSPYTSLTFSDALVKGPAANALLSAPARTVSSACRPT